MLLFQIAAVILLRVSENGPRPSAIIYLLAFVPVVVLTTVTQANLFGVDRGASMAALAGPLMLSELVRIKVTTALFWTGGILAIGAAVVFPMLGSQHLRLLLLQAGLVFLLAAAGSLCSVLFPASARNDRIAAQTTPLAVTVLLNTLMVAWASGSLALLASVSNTGSGVIAAALAAGAALIWRACLKRVNELAASRREQIAHALREAP